MQPTYFRDNGFVTAGNGKLYHPDACAHYKTSAGQPFSHSFGDDPRAWNYGEYGVEANVSQEQWGSIPGPRDPKYNGTMGLSFFESPLSDEEETDGTPHDPFEHVLSCPFPADIVP